jgi:60 kDa SS-A/Ro ribonucleoprotein
MVHPKPTTVSKEALFGYLLGRERLAKNLPPIVQAYEDFKKDTSLTPPNVPFQMIASLNLGDSVWKEIAKNAKWTMTRMNLNTFARHGVFNDEQLTQLIANRIRNRDEVLEARAFPYQLMVAYLHADENVPLEVQNAIQDAMEIATENVPVLEGNVYVFVDVSASMAGAVTGYRGSATTVVRCVDVASLFASALLRKNSNTTVWPFNGDVLPCNLNSRDSVITNANKLANLCTNGTNISAPLAKLNKLNKKADLVIYLSDNESWMDGPSCYRYNNATASSAEWTNLKRRCPNAKLVCINLTPAPHSQVKERKDVYNIGGFSDEIFSLIYAISRNEMNTKHWIGEIERIVL